MRTEHLEVIMNQIMESLISNFGLIDRESIISPIWASSQVNCDNFDRPGGICITEIWYTTKALINDILSIYDRLDINHCGIGYQNTAHVNLSMLGRDCTSTRSISFWGQILSLDQLFCITTRILKSANQKLWCIDFRNSSAFLLMVSI